MAATLTPDTPPLVRAASSALVLEKIPVDRVLAVLAAPAAVTMISAVMTTDPELMLRVTAELATLASVAITDLMAFRVAAS